MNQIKRSKYLESVYFVSVTYMVLTWMFWILDYVPFIPATPIVIGMTIWILHPKYKGEGVAYLIMSDYFNKFEEKMRIMRNTFFESILWLFLFLASFFVEHCRTKTSNLKLLELRKYTEEMDIQMVNELYTR